MPAAPCRARRSPLRRRSRHSACPLTADRAARQPEQRRTQPAILSAAATSPRRGATFPRLSGATSGNATEDAAVIAIRSPGGAAPRPICCRSTTCCQSPRGVAGAVQLGSPLLCSSPHAPRLRTGGSAGAPDVAPPPRCCRAARLRWPTARRWPAGTHFAAPRAERASSLPPLAVPVPTAAGAVPGHPARPRTHRTELQPHPTADLTGPEVEQGEAVTGAAQGPRRPARWATGRDFRMLRGP